MLQVRDRFNNNIHFGPSYATVITGTLYSRSISAGGDGSYSRSSPNLLVGAGAVNNNTADGQYSVTYLPRTSGYMYYSIEVGERGGLLGTYYNGNEIHAAYAAYARTDATIDFNWGRKAPPLQNLSRAQFAVRWTGHILPPVTGNYTFYVNTSGGCRLWVNGVQLIHRWHVPRGLDIHAYSGNARLTMGRLVPIVIDYLRGDTFDGSKGAAEDARVRLDWSHSSFMAREEDLSDAARTKVVRVERSLIPSSAMYQKKEVLGSPFSVIISPSATNAATSTA